MRDQLPEDRRAHIRIVDRILFSFKFMDKKEYEALVEKVLSGAEQPFEEYSMQWGLPKIDAPLRKLREKDEAMAKVLDIIDTKLNLILNLLNLRLRKDTPTQEVTVDISAAGLSFHYPEMIKEGQILQMDIGLLPEQYFFRCFGEVVRNQKDDDEGYKIGVKFIWITEQDRERLIEHIFQQQVLQLRLRREVRDSKECS